MKTHPQPSELRNTAGLGEDRRREVLRHVERCETCREALTQDDPTAVFSLLALEEIPQFSLARLSRVIEAAIDAEPVVAMPARDTASRLDWRAVASVAAALVLAAILGYPALQDDPASRVAQVRSRPQAQGAGAMPAFNETSRDAPPRGLELISSPGEAEVVDLTVGETQVVMIFDKALDI